MASIQTEREKAYVDSIVLSVKSGLCDRKMADPVIRQNHGDPDMLFAVQEPVTSVAVAAPIAEEDNCFGVETVMKHIKTILDCALECAAKGWCVFPCKPNRKEPATPNGINDATTDPAVIRRWWAENPNLNYGVVGGDTSNLVLFDIDEATPEEEAALNLPETFCVQSGRIAKPGMVNGTHRYYRGSCATHSLFAAVVEPITQRETLNKRGEKVIQSYDVFGRLIGKKGVTIGEVRSRGAYVIGYGSIHTSGNPYVIVNDVPLANSPEINTEQVNTSTAASSESLRVIADYVEQAFTESGIDWTKPDDYNDGLIWLIDCPWDYEHSGGKALKDGGSSSAVLMLPSGALSYVCKHAHCEQTRQWAIDPTGEMDSLRGWMESAVGHKLSFQEPTPEVIFNGVPVSVDLSDEPEETFSLQDKIIQLQKLGKSQEEIAEESGFNKLVAEWTAEKAVIEKDRQAVLADVQTNWTSKFRSVGEMEQGDVVMVIDGVLQEGTCFIGAVAGDCKTLVALSMAKAISTGTPLFGLRKFSVKEPRSVIYLIPEVRDRAFRQRCEAFHIPTDKRKFMARTISMGVPLGLDDPYLLEAIKNLKPVVFLDTASRFMTSDNQNDAAQNQALVKDVITLLAAGAVTVVLLHHATKASKKASMDLQNMLSGTGDFSAMCDQAYGLQKDDKLYDFKNGPLEVTMVNLKDREEQGTLTKIRLAATHKVEGIPLPVSWINSGGDFHVVDESAEWRSIESQLITLVQSQSGRVMSLPDLADEVGQTQKDVRRILTRLGWHSVPGGKAGASPWHQDGDKPCPYVKADPKTVQDGQDFLEMQFLTSQTVKEADILISGDRQGLDERIIRKASKRLGIRIRDGIWTMPTQGEQIDPDHSVGGRPKDSEALTATERKRLSRARKKVEQA